MADWNDFVDAIVRELGHEPHRVKHALFRCVDLLKQRRGQPIDRGLRLGMSSLNEQTYFEWYAAHLYKGRGRIVEQGAWLGALTKALLAGLSNNTHIGGEQRKLYVYDLFEWEAYMDDYVRGTQWEGRTREGEDYSHLFLESMGDAGRFIDLRKEDLQFARWDGPIELLLVDAMKSMPLAKNILAQFFPKVIEGDGLVAHQDYLHPAVGWLQISAYLLRDYLEPVFQVPDSDTVVFRCTKELTTEAVEFPDTVNDFDDKLIDETYAWNWTFISDDMKDRLGASKVWLYVYRKEFDRARSLYADYRSMNLPRSQGLDMVRDHCRRWDICELE